jgi:hypothetical protein
MEIMVVLVIVLGVGLLASVGGLWYCTRPLRYSQRVLVNLKTGTAIEGVHVSGRGRTLTLAEPSVHDAHTGAVEPAEGRALVYRDNIDFVQVLGRRGDA